MNINQASKIRQDTCLIDILQRKYWVKNYYLQYQSGQLDNVYLDLEDQFGARENNVSYKYLYYCIDEFSDAEKSFYDFVSSQTNRSYYTSLDHEQLYMYLINFIGGFYAGFSYKDKK